MKKDEKGRSMVEVLGVLALMGILSVVAVAGFRVMINKNKANTVISEAKLAFIEAHAKQNVSPLNAWEDVSFQPSYNYRIQTMRDFKSNDYVKVLGVSEEICAQMLPMQVEGQLSFYTEDYEELTDCKDETTIVVAWNGIGVPAECGVSHDCDVGEYSLENTDGIGFSGFCNSSGKCQPCNPAIETVNNDRTGCDCDPMAAVSCSSEDKHWCCPTGKLCGWDVGECVEDNGCWYDLTQTTTDNTCHYTLSQATISNDCHYSLSQATVSNDCHYQLDTDGNGDRYMKALKTCKSGFCYLKHGPNGCGTSVSGSDTDLWGTCNELTSTIGSCSYTQGTLSVQKACKSGFCYLKHGPNGCGTSVKGTDTDLWGTCNELTSTVGSCSYTQGTLSVQKACKSGFCYLKYGPNGCGASVKGTDTDLWGTCNELTSTVGSCSYTGAGLNPQKHCPPNYYCYLLWKNQQCQSTSQNIETIYGRCKELSQNDNLSCPTSWGEADE